MNRLEEFSDIEKTLNGEFKVLFAEADKGLGKNKKAEERKAIEKTVGIFIRIILNNTGLDRKDLIKPTRLLRAIMEPEHIKIYLDWMSVYSAETTRQHLLRIRRFLQASKLYMNTLSENGNSYLLVKEQIESSIQRYNIYYSELTKKSKGIQAAKTSVEYMKMENRWLEEHEYTRCVLRNKKDVKQKLKEYKLAKVYKWTIEEKKKWYKKNMPSLNEAMIAALHLNLGANRAQLVANLKTNDFDSEEKIIKARRSAYEWNPKTDAWEKNPAEKTLRKRNLKIDPVMVEILLKYQLIQKDYIDTFELDKNGKKLSECLFFNVTKNSPLKPLDVTNSIKLCFQKLYPEKNICCTELRHWYVTTAYKEWSEKRCEDECINNMMEHDFLSLLADQINTSKKYLVKTYLSEPLAMRKAHRLASYKKGFEKNNK